jgi:hypothetical protein
MNWRHISCAAAAVLAAAAAIPAAAQPASGAGATMPRTADGKPDLNGLWGAEQRAFEVRRTGGSINIVGPDVGTAHQAQQEAAQRARQTPFTPNGPQYKAEFRALVQKTYDQQDKLDPVFACALPGVPRLGPPQQIVQAPGQLVFLYTTESGDTFRVIPTDGRGFRTDIDPSKNGDSVGRWEGDMLVVEVRNFVDSTWLQDGYPHSDKMRVVERLRREGDKLNYEVTVHDPAMLTAPWVRNRALSHLSTPLEEALPCMDVDRSRLLNNDHH